MRVKHRFNIINRFSSDSLSPKKHNVESEIVDLISEK